jgi:hypothetical protein
MVVTGFSYETVISSGANQPNEAGNAIGNNNGYSGD